MADRAAVETIDTRGLKCPLPVLRLEKRASELPAGTRLAVLATDPIARIDIPLFCRQNDHACTLTAAADGELCFAIVLG